MIEFDQIQAENFKPYEKSFEFYVIKNVEAQRCVVDDSNIIRN
jgi:hypothetical protein